MFARIDSPQPTSATSGVLTVRRIEEGDIDACACAAFESHQRVAGLHNVPAEQPSLAFATGLIRMKLADPRAAGWVAARAGEVVGSIFLNDFSPAPVAAIGPLTVHPAHEGGAGHALLEAALADARERRFESVRLVQSPSHLRSLALYVKHGFEAREPLVLVQGQPAPVPAAVGTVRPATRDDAAACTALCERVHGFAREGELARALDEGSATLVERDGVVTAYATSIGLRGHAVGVTADDLARLVERAAAPKPGFFLPIRDAALLRWAFAAGLRAAWPALLMSMGRYRDPKGSFLPSIAY